MTEDWLWFKTLLLIKKRNSFENILITGIVLIANAKKSYWENFKNAKTLSLFSELFKNLKIDMLVEGFCWKF